MQQLHLRIDTDAFCHVASFSSLQTLLALRFKRIMAPKQDTPVKSPMNERELLRRTHALQDAVSRTSKAVRAYAACTRSALSSGVKAAYAARTSHAAICAMHNSAIHADRAA
eukprot:IDg4532t1